MIPDLQSSLLCDDVRQERNGKFILIGVFDGLNLPAIPFTVSRLCLVNRWCCGEGEFHQQTRIMIPGDKGELLAGRSVKISLADESRVATSIEFFMNIPFREAGLFWIEISLEEQLRLRYPLRVRFVKPPPPASGDSRPV